MTATLTSTWAGDVTVTATLNSNGSRKTAKATFVGDIRTAQVSTVLLDYSGGTSKEANGTSYFTYTVTVKDANGNLVQGATVAALADKGNVTLSGADGKTDSNGHLTLTLTSTTTPVVDILVSAQVGTTPMMNADRTVSFITAKVASVTLVGAQKSKSHWDGDTFYFTVKVVDTSGNPLQGIKVVGSVDKKSDVLTVDGGVSGADGLVTITLQRNNAPETVDIQVSAGVEGDSDTVAANLKVSFTG